MPNWLDLVQGLASVTLHISELRADVRDVRKEVQTITVDVAGLKAAQATTRETVRAEVAQAVAELRVQYAQAEADLRVQHAEEANKRPKELPDGEE